MFQKTILVSALSLALGQIAMAQDNQTTTTDVPATEHQQTTVQTTDTTTESPSSADTPTKSESAEMESIEYDVRASDLLGAEIENAQDDDLGEIDDLIITGDNKVLHAIISVGGFLGVGDKQIAVPYDELEISREADDNEMDVVYNVTREELESMPAFRFRDGDMSWRERMQNRMGEWTDKAKDAVKGITQDNEPSTTETTTNQ